MKTIIYSFNLRYLRDVEMKCLRNINFRSKEINQKLLSMYRIIPYFLYLLIKLN